MIAPQSARIGRRSFLQRAFTTAVMTATALRGNVARGAAKPQLEAGEGVVDTTPSVGIELGGFHGTRLITGIRQRTAARALVLRVGGEMAAVVSLDALIVSPEMSARVGLRVAEKTGIPAGHVRLCATHTHSMPGFIPLRQWGAVPRDYMAAVEAKVVEAVQLAKADLTSAELSVGTSRAVGGNFNRTTGKWMTDAQFTPQATDDERWLDTLVQVLRFDRAGGQRTLLWYHFSAHPVCYADTQAGPDWPGLVDQHLRESEKLAPVFLQGHPGDVNPGNGKLWRGDAAQAASAVHDAVRAANAGARAIKVDTLKVRAGRVQVPLDIPLLQTQLDRYRANPAACASGEWVDAGFAKDWFKDASKWDPAKTHLPTDIAALQLGELGWIFHPAELFSFYGLSIRTRSPLPHTLVVGYADGNIGYLPDPRCFKDRGYEASVVPKILYLPPFTATAGRSFTEDVVKLAKECFG